MIPGGYMQGIIKHRQEQNTHSMWRKKITGCNVPFDYTMKLRPGLYTRYIICIDTYVCMYVFILMDV
jgi:hypothetical protein